MENSNLIPKKIHYCWFGKNPLPELAIKCIESWKKYLPDYQIIEWNESNYDVHKNPYISQAYDAKKYAFVSDYARFDILYEHGGLYFDTDVEVIKSFDDIVQKGPFVGIETPGKINAGLCLGTIPKTSIYKEILDSYNNSTFVKEDGSLNLYTVVERVSEIFSKYGFTNENKFQFVRDTNVYPIEYFCPKDVRTGALNITDNSYSIHHFDASWVEPWQKKVQEKKFLIYKKYGNNAFSKVIYIFYHVLMAIKNNGFFNGLKYCKEKIFS